MHCRLLDDNRQLYVPELQETINPHPHFMLFATQNPPGQSCYFLTSGCCSSLNNQLKLVKCKIASRLTTCAIDATNGVTNGM